jgi:hypothetical protein
MNNNLFKNALLLLLLTITVFSVLKYASVLKEKYALSNSLKQAKTENSSLVKLKQNLLQALGKEKELKQKAIQTNLELKQYLKSGQNRLSKLFKDYTREEKQIEESSARFSLLKAENASLMEEKQRFLQENEVLKSKLSSIRELKNAIRELKQNMRRAQSGLIIKKEEPGYETPKIAEGNQGFLLKSGKSTVSSKVIIEVIPAFPKE